jgi:Fanconi anemia group M protein
MPLLNIFTKSRKSTKSQEKPKIIADYREKGSLVPSELISLGFEIEFKELKVADYIIKDVAIERKTISDFLSSMTNKRLLRQIEELKQYKNRLLIIEGIKDHELYNENAQGIHSNAIRGFLLSILLKHKIPVILSKDSEDTAKFLLVLAKRKQKELSLNAKKKAMNKKEQMQFILEGFPGIGPATAKKLLKEFKTLKNILNSPLEDLKKAIGKKADIFKLLEDKY